MREIPTADAPAVDCAVWSNAVEQIYRAPAPATSPDSSHAPKSESTVASPATTGDAKVLPNDANRVTDSRLAAAAPGDGWNLPQAVRMQLSQIGEVVRAPGQGTEFKGFSFTGQNREEQIAALKKFKSPVDYKQLLDNGARIALFGETHPVNESRDELINNMADFKKLGFTHIALEALPSNRQQLVDDYHAGKATREQVLKALEDDWGWNPESYMKMIDSAKALGLKTICLDVKIPQEQRDKWNKDGQYSRESEVREAQWAKIMAEQLAKDPKARIVALAGKGHTGIDETKDKYLTSLLSKAGLKTTVIELAGESQRGLKNLFDMAVDAAGLNGERFMIPVYGRDKFRPSDYMIHLPSSDLLRFPFLERPNFRQEDIPMKYRMR
jgi:hypothetical protein